MRSGWVLSAGLALTVSAAAAQEAAQSGGDLSREECIALLAQSEEAKEAAGDLAEGMQAGVLEAHGPIAVELDPTQPLIDTTAEAWDAFGAALGDLCRDRL